MPPSAADSPWAAARAGHPGIDVPDDALAAFVAAWVGDGAALAARHLHDLYLACACDRADPQALGAFERDVMPAVARALASFADHQEQLQILRERMLVARDGRRGIAAYDGRAPLAIWLRVCATRLAIRAADRDKRTTALDDHHLDELAPGVPDPELAYLKRLYGDEFRTAFAGAVASLAPRERTLLRHTVLDELGIDQIAAIYHVHRATAARQINAARAALIAATRERMRVALRVSESELASIMRIITNVADLTLRQVFARPARGAG